VGDILRPDWSRRLDRAWREAAEGGRATFLVSTPANQQYLCGFTGSAGLLILSGRGPILLLDGRYEHAFREAVSAGEAGPVRVRGVRTRFDEALADLWRDLEPGAVAFEADQVTVSVLQGWQAAVPGRPFVPTSGLVERQRAIKDAHELQIIRRACGRLSEVAGRLADWVAAGRTEREVAADIDAALSRAGFERPAFPTIVASGPNGAHPHARPTDRRLERGDLVVLDFGGVLEGYCGDLTRMAAVGRVKANAQSLVDAVGAAQDAALRAVRGGVFASDVDRAAREVLTLHGLGEAFLHATGHGLGLDVHEFPRIGRADADRPVRLEAGMVCTIEPGAYVEGLGGARMEDDVLVTVDGCEVLTTAPRGLLVV
jgi:Xaa-Pro aminopeptidase